MRASCLFALLVACVAVEAKVQTTKATDAFVYGDKLMAALSLNKEPVAAVAGISDEQVDSIIGQISKSMKVMASKKVTSNIAVAVAAQLEQLIDLLGSLAAWVKSLFFAYLRSGDLAVSTTRFQLKRALNGPVALSPADQKEVETSIKVCDALAEAMNIDLNTIGFPEQSKSALAYPYGGYGQQHGGCATCSPYVPSCSTCQQPSCGAQASPLASLFAPLNSNSMSHHSAANLYGLSCHIPAFLTNSLNFCLISSFIVDIFMVVLSGVALAANYFCSCSDCDECREIDPLGGLGRVPSFGFIEDIIKALANVVINAVFGPIFFTFTIKAILTFILWILSIGPCTLQEIVDFILLIVNYFDDMTRGGAKNLLSANTPLQGAARDAAAQKAMSAVDERLARLLHVSPKAVEGYTAEAFVQNLKELKVPAGVISAEANPQAVFSGIASVVTGRNPAALFGSNNILEAFASSIEQAASAPAVAQKSCFAAAGEANPVIKATIDRLQCLSAGEQEAEVMGLSAAVTQYYGEALKQLKTGGNMFIVKELENLQENFDPAYVQKKALIEAMAL